MIQILILNHLRIPGDSYCCILFVVWPFYDCDTLYCNEILYCKYVNNLYFLTIDQNVKQYWCDNLNLNCFENDWTCFFNLNEVNLKKFTNSPLYTHLTIVFNGIHVLFIVLVRYHTLFPVLNYVGNC